MSHPSFIKVVVNPEISVGSGVVSKNVLLHVSAILALAESGGNMYDVAIKPEYRENLQDQIFGRQARIKSIMATIPDASLLLK